MTRIAVVAFVAVFIGMASQGCGEVDDGGDNETVQSALGSFGAWTNLPNGVVLNAPALAKGATTTLTAFGLGTDSQIYVTSKNASNQWTGVWTQLSNNGGPFMSRPSAVAIDTPALAGRFAIVAMRSDSRYYITIRDQNGGGIVQDWTAVLNGTFVSAPAITFVPLNAVTQPKGGLVLTGLGTDFRIWEARNILPFANGGPYFHFLWRGFTPIFSQTFNTAPAMTYACPPTSASPSMMVAARASDATFRASKFNGTSWSAWALVQNGTFNSGPALATGCGEFATETSIYGRGGDDRIWVSTQLTTGAPSFAQVSNDIFAGTPTAVGQVGFANVAAIQSSGLPFSNRAASP